MPLLAVLLGCLLLAAFKVEADTTLTGELVVEAISHPWLVALRPMMFPIVLAITALAAACALFGAELRLRLHPVSLLICALPFYAAFRSSFEDADLALKSLQAFLLFAFLTIFIAFRRANVRDDVVADTVAAAFSLLAFILVCLNLMFYLGGYGYLGQNARFFGTTVHPNFLGVQMAVCGIILLHLALTGRPMLKPVAIAALAAAVFLLVQSGSRTALVVLAGGFYLCAWRVIGFKARLVAGALLLAVVGIVLVSDLAQDNWLEVYSRGGFTDTRSAAWQDLVHRIAQRPVLGLGVFEGASENSLMRGWAAYGLPYFLIMSAMILAGLASRYRASRSAQASSASQLVAGLFFGLILGSMFEGYLCDNMSVGIVTLVIVSSVIGAPSAPATEDNPAALEGLAADA